MTETGRQDDLIDEPASVHDRCSVTRKPGFAIIAAIRAASLSADSYRTRASLASEHTSTPRTPASAPTIDASVLAQPSQCSPSILNVAVLKMCLLNALGIRIGEAARLQPSEDGPAEAILVL